ncbi:MAG TPA: hypothetical protein VNG53_09235 [Bacteroidia bacterium]|nr:hypothetical protein [Bacteroidia bacterium]
MKKSKFIILVALFFVGLTAFAQTKSITGKLISVKPYNDEFMIKVGNTSFVLIKNLKDKSKTSFEINSDYKDILVEKNKKFEINPKYINKVFKVSYYINGKGWKCIKTIEQSK